MSRRETTDLRSFLEGTSHASRELAALDPEALAIDERTDADWLTFTQRFCRHLIFKGVDGVESRWEALATPPPALGLSNAAIAAAIDQPERLSSEAALWLGRPHFALLLTALVLFRHLKEQQNALVRRHLDHFQRERLGAMPLPARADRVAVLFALARGVAALPLPAGTALKAGKDSLGVTRTYRTETDLLIRRARVSELRTVLPLRRIRSLATLRRLTPAPGTQAALVEEALRLALGALPTGEPRSGAPLPPWPHPEGPPGNRPAPLTLAFLAAWRDRLALADTRFHLRHDELRELLVLRRRRTDAGSDQEWAAINRLLGFTSPPANPREFLANLQDRVGPLDFERDGLSRVNTVEDLSRYSRNPRDKTEEPVRAFIRRELVKLADPAVSADERGNSALKTFHELMDIKSRIDADWRQIRRLLERAGRRTRRGNPGWRLTVSDPADLPALLTEAYNDGGANRPSGTAGVTELEDYDREMRRLEDHVSLLVERFALVVDVASQVVATPAQTLTKARWERLLSVLDEGHKERFRARGRQRLEVLRQQAQGSGPETVAVLEGLVDRALKAVGQSPAEGSSWTWEAALTVLSRQLSDVQQKLLSSFRDQLQSPGVEPRRFTWRDVYGVLDDAQRRIGKVPLPIARTVDWRGLVASADARAPRQASGRWPTFGRPPLWKETEPPEPNLGFALRAPLLGLSEGQRTVTLTLGFASEGFEEAAFRQGLIAAGLGINPSLTQLGAANLLVRVSGPKGWLELPIREAVLASGSQTYWSLAGVPPPAAPPVRPALRLVLGAEPSAGPSMAPFVPLEGEEAPTLQVLLRPCWDSANLAWITTGAFEPLRLEALHLRVEVEGLSDLTMQREERRLDPKTPIEPFGSQPSVGARFYVSHPELIRSRLDSLTFRLTWTGLSKPLASQYLNYRATPQASDFKARLELIDQQRSLKLSLRPAAAGEALPAATDGIVVDLFRNPESATTPQPADQTLTVVPQGGDHGPRPELTPGEDLRQDARVWRWTLAPIDFGHSVYPALAAAKGQELAIALATKNPANPNAAAYQVDPPYTPKLATLRVDYSASSELTLVSSLVPPGAELLHVHPFGVSRMESETPAQRPLLLPPYPAAGELCIGLAEVEPPQQLSLLAQLAEGSSDPELAPGRLRWQILDGERWRDLAVQRDDTAGWLHSGVVVLDLPVVAPSRWLPVELVWIRLTIDGDPASVCETVDLHAQAVMARFEDQGNSPDHFRSPLPPDSVRGLARPEARLAAIRQPYSSFAGRPAEAEEALRRRVSEGLRHRQRALTAWDVERLTLEEFGARLHKVKCFSGAGDGRVEVVVIPDLRGALPADPLAPKAPANLLADIQRFLRMRAPAGSVMRVRNATFQPVRLRLGVRFRPGEEERYSKQRLNEDLVRFLSPWAYDDGAEIRIGGTIHATSLVDFVDRLPYVDYVAQINLFLLDGNEAPIPEPGRIREGLQASISAAAPDVVLVSAREHQIDLLTEVETGERARGGIGYMQVEFDFIVAASPPNPPAPAPP